MIWSKRWYPGLLLAVSLLAGCATAPDKGRQESGGESAITPEFRSRFQQAVALMDQDPPRARQALEGLHQAQPALTGPLLNLCILDFRDDNTEAARGCFKQVLERNGEQPDALNHLGVMARQAGDFGLAEDYYRRALTADPDHLPSLRNLGILLDLYQGQHREALRLYQEYQALLPEPDPVVAQWVADLKNRL